MTTAKLHDITEAEHHADEIGEEAPSLNPSTAHILDSASPLHAYAFHPKLGGVTKPPTDAQDKGSLTHALLLKSGAGIEIIDAKDWRTDAAKEARKEAREAGKLPVLAGKYNDAARAVEQIRKRIEDQGIDYGMPGRLTEQTISWNEYADGKPVLCRGRMDMVWRAEGRILDLKTAASAGVDACARKCIDYGYAIQWAAYTSALEALRPELMGRVEMRFIFAEIEPPYAVTIAEPAGSMQEIGKGRWQRAVETWAKCLRDDNWPGYATGTVRLEAPAWVLAREMEDAA